MSDVHLSESVKCLTTRQKTISETAGLGGGGKAGTGQVISNGDL